MKVLISLLALLLGFLCSTASSQVFKGHKIGETAEQFFSIATMKGRPTTQYCRELLSDQTILKAYDRAKTNITDMKSWL
jgi:hypothetical protein